LETLTGKALAERRILAADHHNPTQENDMRSFITIATVRAELAAEYRADAESGVDSLDWTAEPQIETLAARLGLDLDEVRDCVAQSGCRDEGYALVTLNRDMSIATYIAWGTLSECEAVQSAAGCGSIVYVG
jgi:hypothetical protein